MSVTIDNVTMIEPPSGTEDAVFKVSLDQAHPDQTVTVDFRTDDATAKAGKDYQAVQGTLSFAPGETSKEIAVPIVGGLARGPHDMFTVTLSNPVNDTLHASLKVGTGTILPTPWLSVGDATVSAGANGTTDAVFQVTLDPPNKDQVVSVQYGTVDGSAKAGSDYQATKGTLTFAPGETSKTIRVPIQGGTSVEPTESFTLNLSSPENAVVRDGQGTATITNENKAGTLEFDRSSYRIDPGTGTGTTTATATVKVTRHDGAASGVSVAYTTKGDSAIAGIDYTPVTGTLTFDAGQTSQTIQVPILASSTRRDDRSFDLVLSQPTGGGELGATTRTTLTIAAPPATPAPTPSESEAPAPVSPPPPPPPSATPTPGEPKPAESSPSAPSTTPASGSETKPDPSPPTTTAPPAPAPPAPAPSSTVVTTTQDEGPGSLRQAILNANSHPGPDAITFQIPGEGMQTIRVASPLPTITDPVTIDGTTQPGSQTTPRVELNGAEAGPRADGLRITAGGSTVRGLTIASFSGSGIRLQGAGGNQVQQNVIGTTPDGATAQGNGEAGITVEQSGNNTIGGVAATGNLISGNGGAGIVLSGAEAKFNVVRGNHIGTDLAGDDPIGNRLDGIVLENAPLNQIGGAANDQGNVISGNQLTGVRLTGAGSTGNLIEGNKIGTDQAGTRAIGNRFDGLFDDGAPGNIIGGSVAGAGNLISGNGGVGLQIHSPRASGNQVQGNRIGTDAEGLRAIGNGQGGVFLNNAGGNTIGGPTSALGNLISGNPLVGLQFNGRHATGNVVQANRIGTNDQGAPVLGNAVGVYLGGTAGNTIEAAGPAKNTVSGNFRADLASRPIPASTGRQPRIVKTATAITEVVPNQNGPELASLAVTFNQPVDRTRAQDISNYRLRLPGRSGSFQAPDAVPVPLRSAAYDSASNRVTLVLAAPLRTSDAVQLRVSGRPGRGVITKLEPGQAGTDEVRTFQLRS